jgi:hypothetical protein
MLAFLILTLGTIPSFGVFVAMSIEPGGDGSNKGVKLCAADCTRSVSEGVAASCGNETPELGRNEL